MFFLRSPLCRAGIAAALALALAGCAAQGNGASAVMLSGGGSISSDRGATSSSEASEPEAPSFQELPSSESSSQAGEAAPPASSSEASSEAPSSSNAPSSSEAPPVSSKPKAEKQKEPVDEDNTEEEPDDEEYDEDNEDEGDGDDEKPEGDKPDDDNRYNENTGWEDLKVRSGGSTVSDSAVSIVARIVQNEMNSSFPDEAIKAQAVAAYTFVRYHNAIAGDAPSVGLSTPSEKVNRLVREVAGEQITYNGKPILATYCAMSAGTTTSSQSVWGSALPYLVPVDSEGDKAASGYRVTTDPISAGEVQRKLENYLKVDLNGVNPADWFDILSYWDGGPYVNKVSIAGQKESTGRVIRESILGLRSAAFEVNYDKGSGKFTFTTYGYGHGVGMSQMGAKYYADQGWDYVEILEHYYSGATVG